MRDQFHVPRWSIVACDPVSVCIFHGKRARFSLDVWYCSGHWSISFRESMPPPRESATHWPINWQSALIPFSSKELFFLVPSFCVSTGREPWASSPNRSLSHHSNWFHLEPISEEHAAVSFTHVSYEPKTNILTSDAKRDTFSLSLLYACCDNKPFFVVLFKRSFVIHLCC